MTLDDEFGKPYEIILTTQAFFFGENKVEIVPELKEKIKTIHFFFDRTIIEIFINEGLFCATKVIYPDLKNLNFELFS